jgi:ABC-type nickel/cobalt efflux system permease component RcnA
MTNTSQRLALFSTISALAIGSLGGTALAKNGADDPAGHNRGDDHGAKVERVHNKRHRHHARHRAHAARHGADDGRNHDEGDDRGAR